MGFVSKTLGGKFRANWRDPSGKQCAKTFATKREANTFLAQIETAKGARGVRFTRCRSGAIRRARGNLARGPHNRENIRSSG
jgi:hypothetical protein